MAKHTLELKCRPERVHLVGLGLSTTACCRQEQVAEMAEADTWSSSTHRGKTLDKVCRCQRVDELIRVNLEQLIARADVQTQRTFLGQADHNGLSDWFLQVEVIVQTGNVPIIMLREHLSDCIVVQGHALQTEQSFAHIFQRQQRP